MMAPFPINSATEASEECAHVSLIKSRTSSANPNKYIRTTYELQQPSDLLLLVSHTWFDSHLSSSYECPQWVRISPFDYGIISSIICLQSWVPFICPRWHLTWSALSTHSLNLCQHARLYAPRLGRLGNCNHDALEDSEIHIEIVCKSIKFNGSLNKSIRFFVVCVYGNRCSAVITFW